MAQSSAREFPLKMASKISDEDFTAKLQTLSRQKERSSKTLFDIHLPELHARLSLPDSPIPPPPPSSSDDPYAYRPDLSNAAEISAIYLGSSMLERLKTTGASTQLSRLPASWNAGCGGDKNENVIYRLANGIYALLKSSQEKRIPNCDIQVWVLASGTNNLHPKRAFRGEDVESWRALVEACLRIAPESKVVACDMFYRKDEGRVYEYQYGQSQHGMAYTCRVG